MISLWATVDGQEENGKVLGLAEKMWVYLFYFTIQCMYLGLARYGRDILSEAQWGTKATTQSTTCLYPAHPFNFDLSYGGETCQQGQVEVVNSIASGGQCGSQQCDQKPFVFMENNDWFDNW